MKRSEIDALVSATRKILDDDKDSSFVSVSREEFDALSRLSSITRMERKYIFDNGEDFRVDFEPGFCFEFYIEEATDGQKYMIRCYDKVNLTVITHDFAMFYKKIKLPQSRKGGQR